MIVMRNLMQRLREGLEMIVKGSNTFPPLGQLILN
jgi:hypothetical protein